MCIHRDDEGEPATKADLIMGVFVIVGVCCIAGLVLGAGLMLLADHLRAILNG